MKLRLRDYDRADLDWALALNNGAVPAVNGHDAESFAALIGAADYARVALGGDGAGAGLLVVFGPGAAYRSPNYLWFDARYDDFLYVDRIVVDGAARGQGIGRALYGELFAYAGGRARRITCEVNLKPPNPGSLRFHERAGFRPVGEQSTDGGAKQVRLLEKLLSAPAP